MPSLSEHPAMLVPLEIASRVRTTPTHCWLWQAKRNKAGYGILAIKRKSWLAHRYVFASYASVPLPPELDHLCRRRACVNPKHLEGVTHRENILRGNSPSAKCARQTHCANGHEYTIENTIRWNNTRRCRICRKASQVTATLRYRKGPFYAKPA